MLEAVGVIAVAAIGGAAAGLHVGGVPGFRPQGAQKGRGVEGPGADFHVQRLEHHAALFAPELLQAQHQILKAEPIGAGRVRARSECHGSSCAGKKRRVV